MITRPGRFLIGIGAAAILALPNITADTGFGPWHFTVRAEANQEFREVYGFPSRRACEAARAGMRRDVALLMAEHGGTIIGDAARRLHFGVCGAVQPAPIR